jgi:Tfp pilus assembly protein PilF
LALAAVGAGAPAAAQTVEELEQVVRSSERGEAGLALARAQIAAGSVLEALATLDRTLASDPKNKQARLLHAEALCRIDDPVGAWVEYGRLREKDYPKARWEAAMAACPAVAAARESGR